MRFGLRLSLDFFSRAVSGSLVSSQTWRRPQADAARQIFSAIVYVLRTGCQWKALPREFGSASAVHLHFQKWQQAGFFLRLWQTGLAEYDEMEAIAWNWQSIDGAMHKAPLATECVGPTPRIGKKMGANEACWSTGLASRYRSSPAAQHA